jgi:structure-specific endonuclease subunit SLX1
MDVKPIPAFYCCYLLRSTIRHASLYVGSTPNPRRRLAQHNGQAKGGAIRTSRISLRPWEMTCIVAGFPSNIAALQFEWAWQNAHLTRHIPHDERISFATTQIRTSPKTGRTRKRPGRPKTSLSDKLSNLHLLLRVPYFSQWPLELRFFSEDVFQFWQTWCQRVDAQISPRIKVWLDKPKHVLEPITQPLLEGSKQRGKLDGIGQGGVNGIDPTYASLRPVMEKSQLLLEPDNDLICDLCKESLDPRRDLITVCSQHICQSIHHMTCLSSYFLKAEETPSILPTSGACPSCKTNLLWVDLMKEMTLRNRGGDEIDKILRAKKRTPNSDIVQANSHVNNEVDELDIWEEVEEEVLTAADVVDEDDEADDDDASVTSAGSDLSHTSTRRVVFKATAERNLPTVIEDSDDEIIDLLSD